MSRGNERAASKRTRIAAVTASLSAVALAGALLAAPPAAAAPARTTPAAAPTASATASPVATPIDLGLAVDLAPGAVLTLPADDGLRDRLTLRVLSGRAGSVDLDAIRGKKTVHLATKVALRSTKRGWARTIAVRASKLKAGSWRIRVKRSAMPGVLAWSASPLRVGTGAALHVGVRPAARTLYPYRDGALDSAVVTVTAKDETGTVVPVTGTLRIDAAKKHVTRKLGRTGTATVPITGLPLGAAVVKAVVTGPSGEAAVRTTPLTLAPTGVGAAKVVRSADTVQPVVDGLLDSVTLTTTGAASAGSTAKVSGTLTITKGRIVAASFPVPDGLPHAFVWNGRVAGAVVPGSYTVTLTMKGPQGLPTVRTKTLVVTKDHLPYAVQDLFTVGSGNQQGLAVRNNMFYVGYDIGNDRSRIDVYDGGGMLMSSLGPLPIAHVAELGYSTVTGMLYAATGGASTPTKVFVLDPLDPQWTMEQKTDPAAAIRRTFDLSGTLGNNAMLSVDDANNRLLVFSGATGGFSVSSVTMTDTPALNADGTPALNDDGSPRIAVPAGTVTATVPVAITGVPQGMDLVGSQLWIYTSLKRVNHVAKYDLSAGALLGASAASTAADLYWGGEGEGMATVAAPDTGDGLPAWIFVGAHDAVQGGPNRIGQLVRVADE